MSKDTDSERVKMTKKKMKDAFVEILKVKTIDNITVKELTNKVGVNRGTFYIHYQDIYSLWGEIEEETLAEIHKLGSVIKDYELTDAEDLQEPIPATLEVLHYLKSNENYIQALLGQNGMSSFTLKWKAVMKQYLFSKAIFENKEYNEYLLEFLLSANIGVIVFWVQSGMKISPEELALLLKKMIIKGPLNV
ncbi:TetR/AcrR family transcriptional regulator C-terminal domain-containing protein [Paenibacillus sp. HN-1]|uniref:TetR/AcrR family transcriptional regulator n=1 Tax=Paenibacillus TaxID=44249 RepID=UPI001CA87008|nr:MULTISPECIES: TetR/AcrR family transcriptional regulator C-terminal domain-containing protein [Paenibacillus]MBY9081167.1 TetR/AcrR family transcriptional regulator C-terminal domain-containing protein [Paenibacillus sp. CGMCC 1.18879]MBY9087204.1 TetR/AcrR family transcriptional regulator C-terminal domain-containing protein [Paenibacillus sinensis]